LVWIARAGWHGERLVLVRFLGVQKLAGFLRIHLPGRALIFSFIALAGMLIRR